MSSDRTGLLTQFVNWVARRIDSGEPVTAPGVPPDYGDPVALITSDCIRPPSL